MPANSRVLTLATAIVMMACYRGATLPTPPGGAIVGSLHDTSGAAFDEASVRLRRPGSATDLRATLTDGAGQYVFTGVAPGTYDVFLIVPAATALSGANPRTVTVTEARATDADFTLTLRPVSFADHVAPVLKGACTGCHSAARGAPLGLKLTGYRARSATVGVASAEHSAMALIRPWQPDSSYLVHKIQGTQGRVGGSGSRMPQGFPPLPKQTIRMIRRWVAQGAPRN